MRLDSMRVITMLGGLLPLASCAPEDGRADGGAATHTVEIQGFLYEPPALTVAVGDTVVWINHDLVPHTATAPGSPLNTGSMAAGDSSRFVASEAGEYPYVCEFHPNMEGILTVQ